MQYFSWEPAVSPEPLFPRFARRPSRLAMGPHGRSDSRRAKHRALRRHDFRRRLQALRRPRRRAPDGIGARCWLTRPSASPSPMSPHL
jgi:hypothetical protein